MGEFLTRAFFELDLDLVTSHRSYLISQLEYSLSITLFIKILRNYVLLVLEFSVL